MGTGRKGDKEKLRVGEVEWFCMAREAFAMSAKQMSEAFTFVLGEVETWRLGEQEKLRLGEQEMRRS